MTYAWWPLFDLRIVGPRLTLRPMREADLGLLAADLPEDQEIDPEFARFAVDDERLSRGMVNHQVYWRAMGTWRPEVWRLGFVVVLGGSGSAGSGSAGSGSAGSGSAGSGSAGSGREEVIGVQELEGADSFLMTRTVLSSSYLIKSARGLGYGKEMRRAVLALAFGPLGALAAITSAWHDNLASLGVSRSLGYQPNGESLDARERAGRAAPEPDVMVHLRLRREEWLASGQAAGFAITGLDPCRPLFGLPAS
jgi:RimJ/RimL family protein N-acetyltransferase